MSHKPKLAKLVYLTILCLFYCILCSYYPALAGEITTVKLKMWEEYTPKEKDFLRGRWELGGVDAVAEVVEGWDKMTKYVYEPRDYWYSDRVSSLFSALAGNFTIVPLKEWKKYTDAEKTVLSMRWTEEKVDSVVMALKQGKRMPEFVASPASLVRPPYDLRKIHLSNLYLDSVDLGFANLQGAILSYSDLQYATLTAATLQGASLRRANLQDAVLSWANLQDAHLYMAKLQDADLYMAKLQDANLSESNLQGANLQGVNLQDADLYRAHFDSTYLWRVNLGAAKNIRYILWGDTLENRYVIGEEKWADSTKIDADFHKAEITYRDLKTLYKKELLDDVAKEFHYRENEVITKSYAWYQPGRLLRLVFLYWTYGYGSRPLRLFWYSLSIIGLFALIFSILTISPRMKSGVYLVQPSKRGSAWLMPPRRWRLLRDCLYFSLLSFATFGYGALQPRQWLQFFRLEPVEYKPVRGARIFVGIEAAMGIWIFALLVTVLFGR